MQWDDSEHGGFTKGEPWIMVNPNYKDINAKAQVGDPDSVFSYYKKLIALRKQYPVIVYGEYKLLDEENPDIYAYTREYEGKKLLVICNFTDKTVEFDMPEEFVEAECLITNCELEWATGQAVLAAYGAVVFLK